MSVRLTDLISGGLFIEMCGQGYVSGTKHPTLPLTIYNYTHKCQHDRMWNPVTNLCRGLIVGPDDAIVSRSFSKFHNINCEYMPETMLENLPKTLPSITKKMDGSLGVYWKYAGQDGISTRGSFTSDQSKWASHRMVNIISQLNTDWWQWPEGYTPVFEIIYNENRIVVEYPFEDIVLLALINNETGEELSRDWLYVAAMKNNVTLVEQCYSELEVCLANNLPNEEGYVLTWPVQGKPPLKVKVKFEDYVKLHRTVTGMNPKTVWEMLSNGQDAEVKELLEDDAYPDQFRLWLRNWYMQLMGDFNDSKETSYDRYENIMDYSGESTRKDYALKIQKLDPQLQPLVFGLLDGKDIEPMIWKQLKPRGDSKAFRSEE